MGRPRTSRREWISFAVFFTYFYFVYVRNAASTDLEALHIAAGATPDTAATPADLLALAAHTGSGALPEAWAQRLWGVVVGQPPAGAARSLYVLRHAPALWLHRTLVRLDLPVLGTSLCTSAFVLLLIAGRLTRAGPRHAFVTAMRVMTSSMPLFGVRVWMPLQAAAAAAAAAAAPGGGAGGAAAFHAASMLLHARVLHRLSSASGGSLVVVSTFLYGLPWYCNLACLGLFHCLTATTRRIVGGCYAEGVLDATALAGLPSCARAHSGLEGLRVPGAAMLAVQLGGVLAAHLWQRRGAASARRGGAGTKGAHAKAAAAACDVDGAGSSGVAAEGHAPVRPPAAPTAVPTLAAPAPASIPAPAPAPAPQPATPAAASNAALRSFRYVSPVQRRTLSLKVAHPPNGAGSYAAAQAAVRAAAADAVQLVAAAHAASSHIYTSILTFPGCVHLSLSVALGGGASEAEAWQRQLLPTLLNGLPSEAIVAAAPTPAGDAAAEWVYPRPAALAAGAGVADVVLVLPRGVAERVCAAGHTLRVVAAADAGAALVPPPLLLDRRYGAGDLAPSTDGAGGQLRVRFPLPESPAGGAPTPMVLLQLLLCAPMGGDACAAPHEVTVAQLPLLVDASPAVCSELGELLRWMGAAAGAAPGAAYGAGFGDLVRDIALLQRHDPGHGAEKDATALDVVRALLPLLSGLPFPMPACIEQVADAAMRCGLHRAAFCHIYSADCKLAPAAGAAASLEASGARKPGAVRGARGAVLAAVCGYGSSAMEAEYRTWRRANCCGASNGVHCALRSLMGLLLMCHLLTVLRSWTRVRRWLPAIACLPPGVLAMLPAAVGIAARPTTRSRWCRVLEAASRLGPPLASAALCALGGAMEDDAASTAPSACVAQASQLSGEAWSVRCVIAIAQALLLPAVLPLALPPALQAAWEAATLLALPPKRGTAPVVWASAGVGCMVAFATDVCGRRLFEARLGPAA